MDPESSHSLMIFDTFRQVTYCQIDLRVKLSVCGELYSTNQSSLKCTVSKCNSLFILVTSTAGLCCSISNYSELKDENSFRICVADLSEPGHIMSPGKITWAY